MPKQWGNATGDNPNKLWISQVFTHPVGDLASLDRFISAPAPYNSPPGLGYGPLKDRTVTGTLAEKLGIKTLKPKPGYYAGFFPDERFWKDIHVRW